MPQEKEIKKKICPSGQHIRLNGKEPKCNCGKKYNLEEIKKAFKRWYESDEDGEWFDNGFGNGWECFLERLKKQKRVAKEKTKTFNP